VHTELFSDVNPLELPGYFIVDTSDFNSNIPEKYSITIKPDYLLSSNYEITPVNFSVRVIEPPITTTPVTTSTTSLSESTITTTTTSIPEITYTSTTTSIPQTTVSTTTTYYTTPPVTTTTVPTEKDFFGDIDYNNIIDASDASLILGAYAKMQTSGYLPLSEEQKFNADIDKNGIVDASDASKVLGYYAKKQTGYQKSFIQYLTEE